MNVKHAGTWELTAAKKALEMMPVLNTDEENERLEAIKTELRERSAKVRKALKAKR